MTVNTRPRHTIVRFARMRKRMEVFRNKKNLKGKKITITESLTTMRVSLLERARKKYGVGNVWTTERRILTSIDGEIIEITSKAELI